jgi:hypothetical protein
VLKGRELATEERFYQKQQEAIRRMDAEEDMRDEEEEEKRKLVGKVREEQVVQQRTIHNARLAEIKREGEVMAQKAAADLEQEKRQRIEALEHEQKIRAEFVEANSALLGRCAPHPSQHPTPPHSAPPHSAPPPTRLGTPQAHTTNRPVSQPSHTCWVAGERRSRPFSTRRRTACSSTPPSRRRTSS